MHRMVEKTHGAGENLPHIDRQIAPLAGGLRRVASHWLP